MVTLAFVKAGRGLQSLTPGGLPCPGASSGFAPGPRAARTQPVATCGEAALASDAFSGA